MGRFRACESSRQGALPLPQPLPFQVRLGSYQSQRGSMTPARLVCGWVITSGGRELPAGQSYAASASHRSCGSTETLSGRRATSSLPCGSPLGHHFPVEVRPSPSWTDSMGDTVGSDGNMLRGLLRGSKRTKPAERHGKGLLRRAGETQHLRKAKIVDHDIEGPVLYGPLEVGRLVSGITSPPPRVRKLYTISLHC